MRLRLCGRRGLVLDRLTRTHTHPDTSYSSRATGPLLTAASINTIPMVERGDLEQGANFMLAIVIWGSGLVHALDRHEIAR
ncbi:hypothetical protein E2C01_070027 [Portunus trituberculatus]|uniref:Uncharacterized protein n=1 Tax=Portunus trituberculatus TaxID=210409 RepID=A0A5B7I4D0_PORTR|nr:hypothetical protein [Portunus trituberculatus]